MKSVQDYYWNYITAALFFVAAVLFLIANNPVWVAFFPLAVVFLALGSDAQRKSNSKKGAPKEPIEKVEEKTPTKKI